MNYKLCANSQTSALHVDLINIPFTISSSMQNYELNMIEAKKKKEISFHNTFA